MAKRGNPAWINKGKGVSGNPNGRPRAPEIELFREALAQVEKENKISLLVHAVRRAYLEDTVLIALLKKILPDKIDADMGGDLIVELVKYCESKSENHWKKNEN